MASKRDKTEDDMLPEYDFTNGVRGNHARAYAKGHTVVVHKEDVTTEVTRYAKKQGETAET